VSCNNCFNGCVDITSDKCVKYTGLDIEFLGINNGDSLAEVELAITNYLATVLDGTGIIPTLKDGVLCEAINNYIEEGELTLSNLLSAIIEATCTIQTQVDGIAVDIAALNSAYTVGCVTVGDNTDTHAVLQAVITALCNLTGEFEELVADIPNTYVPYTELPTLIDNYLNGENSLLCLRMVPYTVVEFWGDPAGKFDVSGAGYGEWSNIYLCNGNNNTPDKRGRVTVCATHNMGGGVYNAAVDPAIAGNPSYSLYTLQGANNIALTNQNQLPSHTHTATPSLVLADHFHYTVGNAGNDKVLSAAYPIKYDNDGSGADYTLHGIDTPATIGKTSSTKSLITSNTVSVAATGSSATHSNIQPVIAAYYIIYIPA
jgi:microcystin-dependent protein